MNESEVKSILNFWFEESSPADWFQKSDSFDQEITTRFAQLHVEVMENKKTHWRDTAEGCLAEIIILDQFSRNMFRDSPKAFASDERARDCLRHVLENSFDQEMTVQQKNFLYLPLEHSESLEDQVESVALFEANGDENSLDYAIQHKVIIERFGRFPHRNKILGRPSTDEELEFLNQPGSSF